MGKPNKITIDDVEYIRADSVNATVIEFTGEDSVASVMIGQKVIVRSRNEGINIGIVELADETGVVLTSCRRAWYHKPKDKKLSWYEGIAISGADSSSKVSGTIDRKVIIEDYSMTAMSDNAFKSVMEIAPNEQS